MSADNWSICPQCKARAEKEANAAAAKARAAYGKVPVEEYQRMIDSADKLADRGLAETLREDYQIQMMADGTFTVAYSGHCGVCKFTHEFQHAKKVEVAL